MTIYPQADRQCFTWDEDCSMTTTWRPVAGFEGLYEVSSEGRVRRGGCVHRVRYTRQGYCQAALTVRSKPRYVSVHRLVAQAFLAPPKPGQTQVNHINGKRTDNRYSNLEWVTPAENMRHASRMGLIAHQGERNPAAKLSDESVQAIRSRKGSACSASDVAAEFGASAKSVRRIWRGEAWAHLPWLEGPTVVMSTSVYEHTLWKASA